VESQKLKMQAQELRSEFFKTQAQTITNKFKRNVALRFSFFNLFLTQLFAVAKNFSYLKPESERERDVSANWKQFGRYT
jgi:hypothetical protein